MPAYNWNGRVALITGAASGIGRATAETIAAQGADLVLADIDTEVGPDVATELAEEYGIETKFVTTDVSSLSDTRGMVEAATEEFGRLDFAFNNAGIEGESAPTAEYPEDAWQHVLDVNLTGVWNSLRAELPVMLEQDGDGAIVNMASILGKVGFEGACAYTAAKHGVVGLTKSAALEYATENVRINAVCPGFIHTPMIERYGVTQDEDLQKEIEQLHAMNRLGRPEEIADTVVWLFSKNASFVTGESVNIDGGYLSR